MSLEGYKPLDLSALNIDPSQFQLQAPVDTANIAKQILAGTKWDMKAPDSLGANGMPITHKKSFVSRLMDALSVGNYVTSDYLLGALKGHQQSSTDNPVEDILKMGANAVKGTGEGLLASLKGTFGNDATAEDPTGKNHFGDVLLQATAKGREATDPNSSMSLADRKKILKTAYLGGLPSDVLLDPLNLVGIGEAKAAKNIADAGKSGGEAALKLAEIENANKSADLSKVNDTLKAAETNKLPTPVGPNNFDPQTLDFVASTSGLPTGADNLAADLAKGPLDGVVKFPKAMSRLADPRRRKNIAGIMLNDVIQNGSWDIVKAKLKSSFPGMDLAQTHKYIDQLAKNPRGIEGLKRVASNRSNFVSAIDRVLEHDFKQTGRAAAEAAKVPRNTVNAADIVDAVARNSPQAVKAAEPAAPVEKALGGREASILAHVIQKYTPQIETGMFPGVKNADHYAQAIAAGKTVKWSGPKQVNMWQSILKRLPFSGPGKYKSALKILKIAEEHFTGIGHTPYSAAKTTESVPLRLSDVIEKIGVENFAKHPDHSTTLLRSALAGGQMSSDARKAAAEVPELKNIIDQSVEATKAGHAIAEAGAVKSGLDAGATQATVATNAGNSEARVAEDINLASKTAKDIAKLSGAGPVGGKMAGAILKSLFAKSDAVESAITRGTLNSKNALISGTLKGFNNSPAVTHALQGMIASPTPRVLGNTIGDGNRTVEWLGARFNAAYKNSDMRPIYLAEAATARSSVARRAAVWNDVVRQFGRDPELWDRAFKMAQGRYHAPVGSPEQALSKLILSNVENLVGSSGLRTGAELENSVAGRAQLLMKELNANLRRYGITDELTKAQIKGTDDIVRDYSQGTDWLHSWESWNIKDPLSFMMRMQNAIENTVREANMFNEIAARWGTATKAKDIASTVDHPRLAGLYFSKETADQVNVFMKNLEELKNPNSKLMRQLDNILSKWKASVTIYMPSHHIRNMIGDSYMNWLAGVNSAKPYSTAIKVMASQKGRYDSIETLGNLTSPEAVLKAIERAKSGVQAGEKGSNIALTMKNGKHVTNDMIYTAAFQKGLLPGARVLEDLTDDANLIEKFRPLGGKGQAFFQHAAEYREHAIRLAHFVDVIKKSPKNFAGAVEDASRAVRKWHPDGMDMTSFERNIMKRVFPFYSWTRKAIPLMIESLVMNPGKSAAYPKIMGGLGQAFNGGQGTSDPFPVDQLFPQWIRDKGIGPISGNMIINPSNPTLDLASQFSSPLKGAGSMLNPLLRIPAEELTHTEASTGAPITSQADYWTKQLPIFSTVGRVTNIGIGGPTAKYKKQGGGNALALWNLLFAAGLIDTNQYQKQAQFETKAYLKNGG